MRACTAVPAPLAQDATALPVGRRCSAPHRDSAVAIHSTIWLILAAGLEPALDRRGNLHAANEPASLPYVLLLHSSAQCSQEQRASAREVQRSLLPAARVGAAAAHDGLHPILSVKLRIYV